MINYLITRRANKLFLLIISLGLFYMFLVGAVCQDGETRECGVSNLGECNYGTQTCANGQFGLCFGSIGPEDEICGDSKDNDCDGVTDEECECKDGEIRKCGKTDIGVCEYGEQTCQNNEWGYCYGAVYPANETCNGLDDDCNGILDEPCGAVGVDNCFDGIKNQNEQGVDCGGHCPVCATCQDGIKNQNELGIDCGGSCPRCHSCDDGIKNQNEQDVDCGGICESCDKKINRDEDNDGLTLSKELEIGTNPKKEDTDYDGIKDSDDKMPLCPNDFCDVNFNEDVKNCPEDCKIEISFPFLAILIPILIIVGMFFYLKYKSKFSQDKIKNMKEIQKKGTVKFKYKR